MKTIMVKVGERCNPRECELCVFGGEGNWWCPKRGYFPFDVFKYRKYKPIKICREAEVSHGDN